MVTIQFTLFDKQGRYKPVSCLMQVESISYYNRNKDAIKKKAIEKICYKRYWTKADLLRFGYTTLKVREYKEEYKRG